MDPVTRRLRTEIERLTKENARLRSELIVTRLWNPPAELERACEHAYGWKCLPLPEAEGGPAPTLILIAGTAGAAPPDPEVAGRIWRYLLTAAPAHGRIGPFTRAEMPVHLLGYLREQGGRTVIVLNTDLPRGQLAYAARMLRTHAKRRWRGRHLPEMSVVSLLGLWALLRVGGVKSLLAGTVPAAAITASVALFPGDAPADAAPAPIAAGRPSWARDHVERIAPDPSRGTTTITTPRPTRTELRTYGSRSDPPRPRTPVPVSPAETPEPSTAPSPQPGSSPPVTPSESPSETPTDGSSPPEQE